MGTLKGSKLWYACELTRFCQNPHSDSVGIFSNLIVTPNWKDLNGDEYDKITCSTRHHQVETDSDLVDICAFSAAHSFDSATKPHLTNDSLADWTENDYLISDIISIQSIDSIGMSRPSFISRKYYITTEVNNTNSNITISCIKFEKIVKGHRILDSQSTVKKTKGLYASYYLDSPITISPGESKTIEIIINPDLLFANDQYSKKTSAWYVYEGTRLGLGHAYNNEYIHKSYSNVSHQITDSTGCLSPNLIQSASGDDLQVDPSSKYGGNLIPLSLGNLWASKSFVDHNLGIILTDEPLSSYDRETHESIWPYSSSFPYTAFDTGHNLTTSHDWFANISSKCVFTANEGKLVIRIDVNNSLSTNPVDFTLRCLRFIRAGSISEWWDDYGGIGDYSGNVIDQYFTYYLPSPIVIPAYEQRVINITISPKGLSVA